MRAALAGLQLGTRVTGRRAEMEIDGRVAGAEIRSREVNENVSLFSALPELRQWLLSYQRGPTAVARDPQGIRPLVLGKLERGWVVASETAALGATSFATR